MKCNYNNIETLGSWLDGRLAPDRAEELARHVRECPECREQVERLRRMNALLDLVPSHEPDLDFAQRVRLGAERSGRIVAMPARPWSMHLVLHRLAAGVLVLAGVVAGVLTGIDASAPQTPETIDTIASPSHVHQVDPGLDIFAAAPSGSVTEAALAFYSEAEGTSR